MKATELLRTRIVYAESAFSELVLWRLAKPLVGSAHHFKYRLAYVVAVTCVLGYDNEAGKGDHRHLGAQETAYPFTTVAALLADFQADIARWNHESRRS